MRSATRRGRSVCRAAWTGRPPAVGKPSHGDSWEDAYEGCGPSSSVRLRSSEFGLTPNQTEEALSLPTERVERNLAYVEGDLARGKKIGRLGAYTYWAVTEDWVGSTAKGERTQASLFAAASEDDDGAAPAASEVLPGEADRRDREAAHAVRLDARIEELDAEAQAV